MEKICSFCNKSQPIINFYKSRNGLHCYCKQCMKNISRISMRKHRNKLRKEGKNPYQSIDKLNDKKKHIIQSSKITCKICGNANKECLQYHHTDKSTKKYKIAQYMNVPLKDLQSEINKCIVLCANCHRKVEYGSLKDYNFN